MITLTSPTKNYIKNIGFEDYLYGVFAKSL